MSNELVPFNFEGHDIRVEVADDGDVLLVATDVCEVLGIINVSQALERLDEDEKGICRTYTPGGVQELLGLTESGFYTLTIRSNKPQAKPFRRWVTHEVLPQIRKTGKYEVHRPVLTTNQVLLQMAQELVKQEQQLVNHDERIRCLEASQGSDTGYVTILGYCRLRGLKRSLTESQAMGKEATKRAREMGMKLGEVPDERWGKVKSYPTDFLDEIFCSELGEPNLHIVRQREVL